MKVKRFPELELRLSGFCPDGFVEHTGFLCVCLRWRSICKENEACIVISIDKHSLGRPNRDNGRWETLLGSCLSGCTGALSRPESCREGASFGVARGAAEIGKLKMENLGELYDTGLFTSRMNDKSVHRISFFRVWDNYFYTML